VAVGVLSDTFETAITWDRFEEFHETVTEAAEKKAAEVSGEARVSCRFTHVYPGGPAPYYTVLAPAKRGGEARRVSVSLAADALPGGGGVDLIALHDALDRLSALDARKGQIVELKFFGGLTIDEIAAALDCSPATVERDWNFSRAWLYDALAGSG